MQISNTERTLISGIDRLLFQHTRALVKKYLGNKCISSKFYQEMIRKSKQDQI